MVMHAASRSKIQKIRLRQNNIIIEGDNAKSKSQHWALPVWISLSKNVGLSKDNWFRCYKKCRPNRL